MTAPSAAAGTTPLPPELARYLAGPDGIVQRVRLGGYAWCERDESVLLARVAPGEPGEGTWALPGGGLDFGEDPAAGAIREVREETGYDIVPGRLLTIRSAVVRPEETVSGHRLHILGLIYEGTIVGGELRNELDGTTDLAAWVPFADLDTMAVVDLVDAARRAAGR